MSGAGCYSACACRVERLASDSRYPAIDDRAALGHDLSGLDCEVRSRIRSRSISAGIAATMNSILSGDHVPAGTVQPDADAGQSLQRGAGATTCEQRWRFSTSAGGQPGRPPGATDTTCRRTDAVVSFPLTFQCRSTIAAGPAPGPADKTRAGSSLAAARGHLTWPGWWRRAPTLTG